MAIDPLFRPTRAGGGLCGCALRRLGRATRQSCPTRLGTTSPVPQMRHAVRVHHTERLPSAACRQRGMAERYVLLVCPCPLSRCGAAGRSHGARSGDSSCAAASRRSPENVARVGLRHAGGTAPPRDRSHTVPVPARRHRGASDARVETPEKERGPGAPAAEHYGWVPSLLENH